MLRLRKRGKTYYIRGTVTIGGKSETIKERSTGLADAAKAESFRARAQTEIEERLLYGKQRNPAELITLFEASDMWGKQVRPQKSQRTIAINMLRHLGSDATLAEVDEQTWARLKTDLLPGRKPATLQAYKAVLRAWYRAAGIKQIPDFEVPSASSEIEAKLSQKAADRLINSYPVHVKGPAIVARFSGLRAGEVARLKVRDIDWDEEEIIVRETKTKKARRVPMHRRVIAVMQEKTKGREPEDFVFLNTNGDAFKYVRGETHNPFYGAHQLAMKRAGLTKFRWHDWRHHWAYTYAETDGNLRNLMKVGGWTKMDVLERYLTANDEKIKEAVRAAR